MNGGANAKPLQIIFAIQNRYQAIPFGTHFAAGCIQLGVVSEVKACGVIGLPSKNPRLTGAFYGNFQEKGNATCSLS
jgi:hypothetical protein